MTHRILRSLLALAAAALAVPAFAHEVDCSKLAAIALPDPGGDGPLLDPSGLPSLAAPGAAFLTVNRYPALVAFDESIRNLASEPSVLSAVADAGPADPSRLLSFGDALAGAIPVGGTLRRVITVRVTSQEDCVAQLGADPAQVCAVRREDSSLRVTTESDIASCRARVLCGAQLPPPPPPPPAGCTAPAWTGVIHIPPDAGVTDGYGVAATCDGVTWASALNGSFLPPQPPVPEPPDALFRFDPNGVLTATLRTGDRLQTLTADPTGDLVVVVASGAGAGTPPGGTTYSVRKYDPSFATVWDVPLDLSGAASAAIDGASNVFLAYQRLGAGGTELGVRKLSSAGDLVWDTTYATTARATISLAPDGSVFLTGVVGADPAHPHFPAPDQSVFVAVLDPDGHLVADRRIAVPGDDVLAAVTVDFATGRVAVTGSTTSAVDGGAPFSGQFGLVAMFDAAGTLEWARVLRTEPTPGIPPGAAGSGAGVAHFDGAGAVWVGGNVMMGTLDPSQPGSDSGQAFIARFDAAGTPLWIRQFLWGDLGGDYLVDLRLDPAGYGLGMVNIHASLSFHYSWLVRIAPDGT